MKVPAEIRAVKRPTNTVVLNTGKPGPKQYPVRERAGTVYIPNGNPQPRNGKVIGHIYNMTFIPLQEKTLPTQVTELSYGAATFAKSVSEDVFSDLAKVFEIKEAITIMAAAIVKTLRPAITMRRYATEYDRTFVSEYFPGAALSKNSISNLINRLGKNVDKLRAFYQRRLDAVCADHHIALDGTLIQNTSRINDLSAYSRKARIKGCQDISVLYAYDIELMEPVCGQVFPGNFMDVTAYREFVRSNNITKGILINDKGFSPEKIKEELHQNPDLHFLTPLRRNALKIEANNMYDYQGVLQGIEKKVLYKKVGLPNGHYLYSFRCHEKSIAEESAFLMKQKKEGENFDVADFGEKVKRFGTIVFESDVDLPPEVVYTCYSERWLLELVFKQYKSINDLDRTSVQSDYSVIGMQFVNFIATLITSRMVKKAENLGLLDDNSFKDLMDDLSSAWRRKDAPEHPQRDDDGWVHTAPHVHTLLETLGLSTAVTKTSDATEPRKRGRPRTKIGPKPELVGPKRPAGRPRKTVQPQLETIGLSTAATKTSDATEPRKRGRPRTKIGPKPELVGPKRPPGRPRKIVT